MAVKMIKVDNGKKKKKYPGGQTELQAERAKKQFSEGVQAEMTALQADYEKKGGEKPTWQDAHVAYQRKKKKPHR